MHIFGSTLNVEQLIQSGGLLLIAAIVFAESGLLIGFFLPGDTLLFTAGFFAAQGKLPLIPLLIILLVSAVLGDNVGYSFGRRAGNRIFKKKDGIIFRQEYLVRAEKFYEKHGGKTIMLARFVPVVRTFAPIVAGAAKMPRERFLVFNISGAVMWCIGVTMMGYLLGSKIPNIDSFLLPAVGVAMALSFGPASWHVLKDAETRSKITSSTKTQVRRILRIIGLNKNIDL